MSNRKIGFVVVVVVVLLGMRTGRSVDGDDEHEPVASQIAALQGQRVEALSQVVAAMTVRHRSGLVRINELFAARAELIGAKLAVASTKEGRVALLTELRDLARTEEDLAEKRREDGTGSQVDYLRAKAARLGREVDLLGEKSS